MGSNQQGCKPNMEMLKANRQQPVFYPYLYRIPALCYNSQSKTLFAFAEKRKTSKDSDAEKLVMKTGKRKGDSHEIQWSDLKEVKAALLGDHRTMNPCPVYEENSNKLFLFFICVENGYTEQWQISHRCNKARLCYITTADDGENWSELTDLTENLQEIGDWVTFAVGPGHGIQTHSGRLIVPVYAYEKNKLSSCCCWNGWKGCCSTSFALALYTDDPENEVPEWQFGKRLQTQSGECQMADFLYDERNHIYCNARSTSGHRVEAVSQNEGDDFSKLTCSKEHEKLFETGEEGCQGSVVSFPAKDVCTGAELPSNNTWLLFTHTSHKKKRKDLGVYLNKSPQDPDKWSNPWIINEGASGYSDLAYIGEGLFVCLLERGEPNETYYGISSVMFSYEQVEEGIGQ